MASCNTINGKVCPSRMQDGRVFTDYRPRCMITADLMAQMRDQSMLPSSYDTRMYLQKNAENLMQVAQKNALENMDCSCTAAGNQMLGIDTMAPERYVVKCNSVTCSREETNSSGIGDGRQYNY
jgi:hypothetical protein